MKSVTVCITNYQSGEAVQLAVESVRKHTAQPYSIIVCDDASDPAFFDDLAYLRKAREKGWIQLIESEKRGGHDTALPKILSTVMTDLAMIIDCDIQITGDGWLDEMVDAQEKSNAAIVADSESFPDNPIAINTWFIMLDMGQYPKFQATWAYTKRPDFVSWEETPDALYATGYRIYERAHDQGRTIIGVPVSVRAKYKHYGHISVLSWPQGCQNYSVRQKRINIIREELGKLRREK
jgi:GT2 family glycosyltransferase